MSLPPMQICPKKWAGGKCDSISRRDAPDNNCNNLWWKDGDNYYVCRNSGSQCSNVSQYRKELKPCNPSVHHPPFSTTYRAVADTLLGRSESLVKKADFLKEKQARALRRHLTEIGPDMTQPPKDPGAMEVLHQELKDHKQDMMDLTSKMRELGGSNYANQATVERLRTLAGTIPDSESSIGGAVTRKRSKHTRGKKRNKKRSKKRSNKRSKKHSKKHGNKRSNKHGKKKRSKKKRSTRRSYQ